MPSEEIPSSGTMKILGWVVHSILPFAAPGSAEITRTTKYRTVLRCQRKELLRMASAYCSEQTTIGNQRNLKFFPSPKQKQKRKIRLGHVRSIMSLTP
ncbi:hypothetical protein Zmor_023147 [Zophobas morio]|uniref:Uncharacterized protein n=1 Tax=Zophobas morio TaxID=2755281 RepID=A0AA38HYQ9_9CUCU|nr:hypothetical protein Zmor_023147 [Zophobas morio]